MNKFDLLDHEDRRELALRHPEAALVSAETGEGLEGCDPASPSQSPRDSPRSSCSYPLQPVTVFRSFTRSLVTSSVKIARTGYTFARDYLPPSPIASPIFRSTGEEDDLETEFERPASNGADQLEGLAEVALAEIPTEPASTLGAMEELRFAKLNEKATRAHSRARQRCRTGPLRRRGRPACARRAGQRRHRAGGRIPGRPGGLVLPRSGLALKHGVTLVNSPGLIDPGYRGEVRVLLLNTDQTMEFQCTPGDRIAQLLLVPIATASPMRADALDDSIRGAGPGFGFERVPLPAGCPNALRELAEGDLRGLALGGIADLEEGLGGEAALVGDDRAGPLLDPGVVLLDVRVVDPAGGLDLVLQLGELPRKLLEVLGGAELRILLGDDTQTAQGLRSAAVSALPASLGALACIAAARACVTFSKVSTAREWRSP